MGGRRVSVLEGIRPYQRGWLQADIVHQLDRFGLTDRIGPDRYVPSLHDARAAFEAAAQPDSRRTDRR